MRITQLHRERLRASSGEGLTENLEEAQAAAAQAEAAAKYRAVEAYRLKQWKTGQEALLAGRDLSDLGPDPWIDIRGLRDLDAPQTLLSGIEATLDAIIAAGQVTGAFECDPERASMIRGILDQKDAGRERSCAILSATDCLLSPGQLVRLTGLSGRPELNGRHGVVIGRRKEERYPVYVGPFTAIDPAQGSLSITPTNEHAQASIRLKPQNLRLFQFDAELPVPATMQDDTDGWADARFKLAAVLQLLFHAVCQGNVGLVEGVLGRAAHQQQRLEKQGMPTEEAFSLKVVLNTPTNSKRMRLLNVAVEGGNVPMVRTLLESGSDALHQGIHGETALGQASYRGQDELVKVLIDREVGFIDGLHVADYHGANPLTCASSKGRISTVRLLLGAASAAAAEGLIAPFSMVELHSALGDACKASHIGCVSSLLAAQADPNHRAPASPAAPEHARPDQPPILSACAESDGEAAQRTVQLLLRSGAMVDLAASDGTTAFSYCCQLGHTSIARLLLEAGADPTIPSKLGTSPLLIALENHHEACAELARAACKQMAERLGQPLVLEQALADEASFKRLPTHSYSGNNAAHRPARDGLEELTSMAALTLTSEDAELLRLQAECCICQHALARFDRVIKLGCGHVYHTLCLCRWLDVQRTCPMCRKCPKADWESADSH